MGIGAKIAFFLQGNVLLLNFVKTPVGVSLPKSPFQTKWLFGGKNYSTKKRKVWSQQTTESDMCILHPSPGPQDAGSTPPGWRLTFFRFGKSQLKPIHFRSTRWRLSFKVAPKILWYLPCCKGLILVDPYWVGECWLILFDRNFENICWFQNLPSIVFHHQWHILSMLNMPGDSPNSAKIFRYKEYENITKKPLAERRPAPREQRHGFQSRWIICASASMSWKLKIDGTKESGIKDLMNWIFCWGFHQKWHHLCFRDVRTWQTFAFPGLC